MIAFPCRGGRAASAWAVAALLRTGRPRVREPGKAPLDERRDVHQPMSGRRPARAGCPMDRRAPLDGPSKSARGDDVVRAAGDLVEVVQHPGPGDVERPVHALRKVFEAPPARLLEDSRSWMALRSRRSSRWAPRGGRLRDDAAGPVRMTPCARRVTAVARTSSRSSRAGRASSTRNPLRPPLARGIGSGLRRTEVENRVLGGGPTSMARTTSTRTPPHPRRRRRTRDRASSTAPAASTPGMSTAAEGSSLTVRTSRPAAPGLFGQDAGRADPDAHLSPAQGWGSGATSISNASRAGRARGSELRCYNAWLPLLVDDAGREQGSSTARVAGQGAG